MVPGTFCEQKVADSAGAEHGRASQARALARRGRRKLDNLQGTSHSVRATKVIRKTGRKKHLISCRGAVSCLLHESGYYINERVSKAVYCCYRAKCVPGALQTRRKGPCLGELTIHNELLLIKPALRQLCEPMGLLRS